MKELMLKLAQQLQAMKMCYHNAHHIASRVGFFADHDSLGSFYGQLDSDFDDVMERSIGLYGTEVANLGVIMQGVAAKTATCPSNRATDNSALFSHGLQLETELVGLVEAICKSPECKESTKQLISEIGNKSEMRQYKIKQRIKK